MSGCYGNERVSYLSSGYALSSWPDLRYLHRYFKHSPRNSGESKTLEPGLQIPTRLEVFRTAIFHGSSIEP